MNNIVDNIELCKVMEILENCSDELLAVKLLKEFNDATKKLGKLLMNLDETLDHKTWKLECDQANNEVENIIKKIKNCV